MALILTKTLPSHIEATYHRILALSIQYAPQGVNPGVTGPLVTVEIGEYLNKAARDAGAEPARREVRTFVAGGDIKAFMGPIYRLLSAPMEYEEVPSEDPQATPTLRPLRPELGYEGAAEG
jgi:hypothetical protein